MAKKKQRRPRLPPPGRVMSLTRLAKSVGLSARTLKRHWPEYNQMPEERWGRYMGYGVRLIDIMELKLFIVSKAAWLLGMTPEQVRYRIRIGELEAHQIEHFYGNQLAKRITLRELLRYRREHPL